MSEAAAPAVPVAATPSPAEVAQTPPKEAPSAEPAAKVRVRAHDRAVKVKARLDSDTSEPAEKPEPEPQEAKPAPKPEPAKAEDDSAKRREERMERLRKAQDRERKEERQRAQEREARKPGPDVGEFERLRKRVAELEPYDSAFASEEALLEAAEQKGMSAEKLVQWMRTRISDPAAVARQQTKTEADKIREEMKRERDAFAKEIADLREQRETERQQLAAQQKAVDFLGRARSSNKSHPLTANFVGRHGENGLINFANQFVAPLLRPDYSLDELHDHIEQLLDEVQLNAAQEARAAGTPEQAASLSPKTGEEQPSTTLSNRLVAQRGSVEEAVPLARLPRSERVSRLKARLGGD
jgi:hypothetical protein